MRRVVPHIVHCASNRFKENCQPVDHKYHIGSITFPAPRVVSTYKAPLVRPSVALVLDRFQRQY